MKKMATIAWLLVGLALVFGCRGGGLDDQGAYTYCQRRVRNELAKPAAASFPDYREAEIRAGPAEGPVAEAGRNNTVIYMLSERHFIVDSYVVDGSATEAPVGRPFRCEVRIESEYGGQGFRLVSLAWVE